LIVRRTTGSQSWGFLDLVKNPHLWNEMSDGQEEVEKDIRAAQTWNTGKVTRAVRHFIFDVETGSDAWGERKVLDSLKLKVHPALLEILQDSSVRSKLTVPTGTYLAPEAPLNRLCDLLGENPPAAAGELLIPFLENSSPEIRKDVALSLGSIGTPLMVPHVRKALLDGNEYVRSHALMGLERAVRGSRLDDRCKRDLLDDVQRLVAEGKNADHAVGLFLELDPKRASAFYLSPTIFTPSSKSLHEALKALAERKIPVPRDRVLALIKELEGSPLEYPQSYAVREALRLLGQNRQTEDREFLEARTKHDVKEVAIGAAIGLLALHGLEDFQQKLEEKEGAAGFSALSVPQQYFSAVLLLDGEVNNGGHSQYFINSSGDEWQKALAGLEAMGFTGRLAIFREAIGKFGGTGPSTVRANRQDQLAKLARKDDTLFDALDERYYQSTEVIEAITARYVITHAEAFK
jgi:HEAT repeat protein